ncbi:MAG: hypothetical protein J0M20_03925 [Burkholderiales bacterium]|nr:hypothetical protein [Burkholderiales bacterium]
MLNLVAKLFGLRRSDRAAAKLQLQCCKGPRLSETKTDLGHAESFEFTHAVCDNCGSHWLHVFCVANGSSGFESITPEQATLMLSSSGAERKAIMKEWSREHL